MSNFVKIILAILLCVCMVVFTPHAASSNCNAVVNDLAPCRTYLQKGGSVPTDCCNGIRALQKSATTTAARQSACECLKSEARAYNLSPKYATSLPNQCNVNVGYPISYNTNCSSIH